MPTAQTTKVRLRSPIPGLTFQQPEFVEENYFAGTEGENAIENWQLWVTIVHDGSNPFLPLGKYQGFRFGFTRARSTEIYIPPEAKDRADYLFFLHPATTLRAIVLSETQGETPGLWMFCRTDGMENPKFWFSQLLLPYCAM